MIKFKVFLQVNFKSYLGANNSFINQILWLITFCSAFISTF